MGEEFMFVFDEGFFLLMFIVMFYVGMQENSKNLCLLDMVVIVIFEVELVVGKVGRVDSLLDLVFMLMYENVILYKFEYWIDEQGYCLCYCFEDGEYLCDEVGEFIFDEKDVIFGNGVSILKVWMIFGMRL